MFYTLMKPMPMFIIKSCWQRWWSHNVLFQNCFDATIHNCCVAWFDKHIHMSQHNYANCSAGTYIHMFQQKLHDLYVFGETHFSVTTNSNNQKKLSDGYPITYAHVFVYVILICCGWQVTAASPINNVMADSAGGVHQQNQMLLSHVLAFMKPFTLNCQL